MNRFDPLNPDAAPEPAGAEPARKTKGEKRGTRAVKSTPATRQSNFSVDQIPLATFACLLGTSDKATAQTARDKFVTWCAAHPPLADWRKAWAQFTSEAAAGADTGDEVRRLAADKEARLRQFQPLTKALPSAIRRILRGQRGHLEAFEHALGGAGEFHARYELSGYLPLCIEVLPAGMCPAGTVAVSVAHYGEQNGDAMRDPEIVLAVILPDAWLAYECTQDYSPNPYSVAFRDRVFIPKIAAGITPPGEHAGPQPGRARLAGALHRRPLQRGSQNHPTPDTYADRRP